MNIKLSSFVSLLFTIACVIGGIAFLAALPQSKNQSKSKEEAILHAKMKPDEIARGQYLVKFGGCADCHSPKLMTDRGPVDDPARLFSGHPAEVILEAPKPSADQSNPWGATTAGMTAWSGPWGMSFSSNLTPDADTGMGTWTREEFVQAMRVGKHRGTGRDILPPMPWQPLAGATDEDLHAIFAYLQSLPAISNRVPDPVPPSVAVK